MYHNYKLNPVALAVLAWSVGFVPLDAAAQDDVLPDEHHDIEEIVVEAAALPRTVEQLAQPTAVLRGEELAKKIQPSIGETLSSELGVSSTYFGPVASRPVIRGQFGERVRVLTNGLDSLDASALSEDHQTSVEGILAERIEIVRGPATLLYGSGAAGGLINVVDNRIIERPLGEPFAGELALNAGSAVGELAGAGWVAFGNERIAVHADYFIRETGDVEIPGFAESAILRELEEAEHHDEDEDHDHEEEEARGTVENSDSSTDGGALGISLTGDNGYIGISVSTFNSDYGVPGGHGHEEEEEGGGAGEEEEEEVSIDLEQVRIDLKGEQSFDSGPIRSVRLRFAINDYEHTEFEGDEVGTIFETDGTDARVEFRHEPIGVMEGAFGFQYKNIDFDAQGDEAYVPPSETERGSLFIFEELALPNEVVLQGSLRFETQTIDGSALPREYDDSAMSTGLGAIWGMSDAMTLALHYSRSERHPNATELYADGPHVAVQRFERGAVTLGNAILDLEVSKNLDLTLRGNTDRIDWTVTAFTNDVDDYIVLSPTADEEDGFQVFEYGQVNAELYGFEAEARVELMDTGRGHLHTRLFSDYVFGEEKASGDYLPRLPPLRYGIGLHYTVDDLEFGVGATVYEDQDKTARNELPTDDYILVGAEASYAMEDRGLYVFLRGSNLTDEDARQHSSPLKDTVPLPGRSVHAGVRFEF